MGLELATPVRRLRKSGDEEAPPHVVVASARLTPVACGGYNCESTGRMENEGTTWLGGYGGYCTVRRSGSKRKYGLSSILSLRVMSMRAWQN